MAMLVCDKALQSVDQVNALKHKNFLPTNDPMPISGGAEQRGQEGGLTRRFQ
jgi:hypothetical protein